VWTDNRQGVGGVLPGEVYAYRAKSGAMGRLMSLPKPGRGS
jgi:hypothetical protein